MHLEHGDREGRGLAVPSGRLQNHCRAGFRAVEQEWYCNLLEFCWLSVVLNTLREARNDLRLEPHLTPVFNNLRGMKWMTVAEEDLAAARPLCYRQIVHLFQI